MIFLYAKMRLKMTKSQIFNMLVIPGILIFISFLASAQETYILEKQWGEFGDKPGQFKFPAMITTDIESNLYVVDQHNHRIQKFDCDGNFITMWGKQGTGNGDFNFPYGIALDPDGDVFVSDMNNNRIQKFNPDGRFLLSAGSYGSDNGQFKYPYGIAFNNDGILYVIDAFNYRIQKFSKELEFIGKWGDQESIGFRLYMPHEIATDAGGNIIMSDRQNHRISVFSKDGALIKRFGEFGEGLNAKPGEFSEPHGLAVNSEGQLFICDRYNLRIQQLNREGKPLSAWLTPGIPDDSKHYPLGITLSHDGCIYVSDHYAHCIQKYTLIK
jgi:tripartite motif-containing protein 71